MALLGILLACSSGAGASSLHAPLPGAGGIGSPQAPGLAAAPPVGNATDSTSRWTGFAGAGNLSGQSLSALPTTNSTLWQAYAGARGTPGGGAIAWSSPAVDRGLVFESTGLAGGVIALNATTGNLAWSATLPLRLPIDGGLLASDGLVFAPMMKDPANGSGILYALNSTTGAIQWTGQIGVQGPLLAPPNLVDGTVVEADAGPGYVYGWSESGVLRYVVPAGGPITSPISILSPEQPLGLAVTGDQVFAFDAATGSVPYPGVTWSPYALPQQVNGSVAQTSYRWVAQNGSAYTVALAIAGDNGGTTNPSDVQVLSDFASGVRTVGSSPLVASWTTPGPGQGFYGAPAVLGQRGANLTFALMEGNGSLAVFRFSANGTGVPTLVPQEFLPWSNGSSLPAPTGSPVVFGGEGGQIAVGTPQGRLLDLSVASRTVLWELNGTVPFAGSAAVANGQLFLEDADGVVHAYGGGSSPPIAPRLLVSADAPLWVEGGSRTNISLTVHAWYPNGSLTPAAGAHVVFSPRWGNATPPSSTTSSLGLTNFTYSATTVYKETNVTIYANATWGKYHNGTSFVLVVVPPSLVNSTPPSILPSPSLPSSLASGQSVPISFMVRIGPGGPPLAGAIATFTAFGGTSTESTNYTNAHGVVNTTFLAVRTTTLTPAGVTVTIEKAGYEPNSYSWVAEVNPLPQLVIEPLPPSLLVVADSNETFELEVNSTSGTAVPDAVVALLAPSFGGNLSTAGGTTDNSGHFRATYAAPLHVPSPGETGVVEITVVASGYATASSALPITVIANATGSSPPASNSGNPLAGLSPGEGWSLLLLLGVLPVLLLIVLMLRPRRPVRSTAPPVWEEWEEGTDPRGRSEAPSVTSGTDSPPVSYKRGASPPDEDDDETKAAPPAGP